MRFAYLLLLALYVSSALVDAAAVCNRNGHTSPNNDFDHKSQCHLELGTRGKNCKSADDSEVKAYPNGDYCFQVFSSDGKTVLSTSKVTERIFSVLNGRIVDINDNSSHEAVGASGCDTFRLNLEPYNESTDGKYRLYIVSKSKLTNGNFPTSGLPSPISFSAAKGGRTNKFWRRDLYLSSSQKDDLSGFARFSTPHSSANATSCRAATYKDFGSSTSTYFAVTYTADITPLGNGVHTIYLTAIDGARLKIDGSVVIDGWEGSSGQELSAQVNLDASKTYNFVVEYYTLQGKSALSLTWSFGSVVKADITTATYGTKPALPTTSVGSNQYCTLEGKHYESTAKTCQKSALSIPDGYELASADDDDAQVAASSFSWGADCLITKEGKGIVPLTGESCGSNLLSTTTKNGKTCHKPVDKSSNYQLLLVKRNSTKSDDTAAQVTTWKGFGYEWAVLDGTPSGSKTVRSCKSQYYTLPSGWELAPKATPCTLAAIYGNWGATDIVIDKTAVNAQTGALGSLLSLDIMSAAGKTYYRASSVSGKCLRVLIRRKDDSAVFQTQIQNVTNFVSLGDYDYATIDDSKMNDPVLACQSAPFQLPVGWSLAVKPTSTALTTFTSTIKKSGTFGTTGLIFNDGTWLSASGTTGTGALKTFVDGAVTYYVADCTSVPKKIVIQRARPKTTTGVPTGAPTAACGTCSALGDPHITNFAGTKATYLGIGDFIYLQPNASTSTAADGTYEIYGRFSPVKTASANSAIFFTWGSETVSIAVPPTSVKTAPTLSRNGAVFTLTLDKVGNGKDTTTGVNINVTLTSGSYVFGFPNGIVSKVKPGFWNNNLLDLYVVVPNSQASKTQGICGPCGAKYSTAIITSTGKAYWNATNTQINEWGSSWSKTPQTTPKPASGTTAPTTAAPTTTTTTRPVTAVTTTAPTSGGCAGDATKTEWTVTFLGATVTGTGSAASTSYQYSVFTTATGKSLSHWVLISSIKDVVTSPTSVLGTDGSTGYYGIKFETSNTNSKTLQFTITYPGTCVVQDAVTYIVKGGNACYHATIQGPGLCTFDTPTTASPTTGAPATTAPPEEVDECDEDLLAKAQIACNTSNGVDAEDVDNCIFDVCVFGDVDAAKSHQQKQSEENNQVVNPDKFGDAACVTPVPVDTNIIISKGKSFAVLDFTAPDTDDAGTQLAPLGLPAGWVIAEDSPFVRSVITCTNFGTSCLLLANGLGLTKDLQVCGTDALQATGDCYSPKAQVSARILITKADTNADLSLDADIDLTNGGSLSNDKSDQDETGNGVIVLSGDGSVVVTRAFSTSSSFSVFFTSKATATGSQPDNFKYTASVSVVAGGNTTAIGEVEFNANLNKWHTRSIDVPATAGVTSLIFTYKLQNSAANTRVLFSRKIRITTAGTSYTFGNLLKNPTVILPVSGDLGWTAFGGGFTYSTLDNTRGDGSGSVQLSSNDASQDFGALQLVTVDGPVTSIYFRGDSKVIAPVDGALGAGYSIYVDIIYKDGVQSTWGLNGQFSNLTTEWQSTEKVFKIPQDGRQVASIQLVALFRKHTGTAVFDNMYLTTMDCDVGNNTGTNTDASSYGDPHLVTLDGVPYDCQRLGDFVLYTDDKMTIITRHTAAGQAAVNSITSVKYGSSNVVIERNKNTKYPFVTVNGVSTSALPGQPVVLNDGTLITSGALAPLTGVVRYDLVFPATGHKVIITAHLGNYGVQWLQVFPNPPRASFGKTGGLLGKYNGDPEDDFTDAFDNAIPTNSTLQVILDSFVETWRVENFVYLVNDMSNYWDPTTAQPDIKDVSDYSDTQVAAASRACQGVSQFDSCVLDTLMTGDTAYAASYNTMESILRASNLASVDTTTSAPASTTVQRSSSSALAVSCVVLLIAFFFAL